MKANMIRKMSEKIQKQRNQSLSIQKQFFKGVLIKRCSEIWSQFTGEHLCRSVISMQIQRATSKTWIQTLNPDPDKPGPWKTWSQNTWILKHMNSGKYGVNMGGIKNYVWLLGVMFYKLLPCGRWFVV